MRGQGCDGGRLHIGRLFDDDDAIGGKRPSSVGELLCCGIGGDDGVRNLVGADRLRVDLDRDAPQYFSAPWLRPSSAAPPWPQGFGDIGGSSSWEVSDGLGKGCGSSSNSPESIFSNSSSSAPEALSLSIAAFISRRRCSRASGSITVISVDFPSGLLAKTSSLISSTIFDKAGLGIAALITEVIGQLSLQAAHESNLDQPVMTRPTHRRPSHHQLETSTRTTRHRLPRPNQPLPLNPTLRTYTNNLTGSPAEALPRTILVRTGRQPSPTDRKVVQASPPT